ncbi:MAG: winged helix-turn-helix transcriptional regulator [Candidatus Kariarchaeaceae archaeon]
MSIHNKEIQTLCIDAQGIHAQNTEENKMLSSYKLPKLPKSAKRIILVLSEEGQMTQKDLINMTKIPAKTVRYALKRLNEQKLVISQHNLEDMRSMFYSLNPDVDFSFMNQIIDNARKLVAAEQIIN